MAPNTLIEEANAASKRKRELDDHGKSKRAKRGKQKLGDHGINGSTVENEHATSSSTPLLSTANGSASGVEAQQQWATMKTKNLQNMRAQAPIWKLSQPVGGRMLNIDPILTRDEKHLILAYSTSIQVYSASESLLVRNIPLPISNKAKHPEDVVGMALSPTRPEVVWVASSTGRLWSLDWTTGVGSDSPAKIKCEVLSSLAVSAVTIDKELRDVLYVSLLDRESEQWQILACDVRENVLKQKNVLISRRDAIENIWCLENARSLAASSRNHVLLGNLEPSSGPSFKNLVYEFFILDCSDEITCLDVRAADRVHVNKRSQTEAGDAVVLDVVVGCARGAIYFYNDLLPQLRWLQKAKKKNYSLQPRKYHWHRKAVHAVKWSRDGNYIVSGGSETVLIQWQVDTGKIDVLPHLTATIENIVLSFQGSSYIVCLGDNSAMILSTAEMKPSTYVSGIQTLVAPAPPSKNNIVTRVGQRQDRGIMARVPAIINPSDPTRLLVCVGNDQQHVVSDEESSASLLQTIDLNTIQGIAKQAMTRTHPTDVNTTAKGFPITEPRISLLSYSHDGKWLATVDEWKPPSRDVQALETAPSERREVFLKFWTTPAESDTLELVSRINAPHYDSRDEPVFDLTADPTSYRFATVGADGTIRIWQPAIRQRDGIVVKSRTGREMESWACTRTIHLQENKALADSQINPYSTRIQRSAALSFSEDGSMLACAFQNGSESSVYVVDVESGKVVDTLDGLISGQVQSIRVLSSQLIVLSEVLVVYDIVRDEMSYGIGLESDESAPVVQSLSQLAVDYGSRSFAIAITRNARGTIKSELAVFDGESCDSTAVYQLSRPIVSLITPPGSSGYLVLDASAQIWSLTQSTDTESIVLAKPLADINLDRDEAAKVEESGIIAVVDNDEPVSDDDEMEVDEPELIMDEDDVHPVVVAPQKLAELFDAAPSFAMPPIEDMFYQVTRLFSTKTGA